MQTENNWPRSVDTTDRWSKSITTGSWACRVYKEWQRERECMEKDEQDTNDGDAVADNGGKDCE